MHKSLLFFLVTSFLSLGILSSCMVSQPFYMVQDHPVDQDRIQSLLMDAEECVILADNRDRLERCISIFEKVVLLDINNSYAQTMLGNLYLLMGDGYESEKSQKAQLFQKAIQASQQAMYQNSSFRKRIESGETVWEASDALTIKEIDAMVFWVTAIFYYYKECLGPIGQAINFPWIKRARTVLEAAEKLNPSWGGGIIYLSWGLYYLSLPEAVGGDREKSAQYFEKAIETGPHHMVNRWARAKYFHVKMKNRVQFIEDLLWVQKQDIEKAPDHIAWKYFFKADAKRLLQQHSQLF